MNELARPSAGHKSDNYKATDLPADLLMLLVWVVVYSFFCTFTEHVTDSGEIFRCNAIVTIALCVRLSINCAQFEVSTKGIHPYSALCYQQRALFRVSN